MAALPIVLHLAAVLLAALALWLMRHELTETAATAFEWAMPPALAVIAAGLLLAVSPGKRLELWALCIGGGLVVGLGAGLVVKATKDFGFNLVRVHRTWDGVGAAALLVLLAMTRFVTTDLMGRPSSGFGVLGGGAALVAAYLLGRFLTLHYVTAQKSIHLDMERGQARDRPPR
jgi:hypothetical protein